MSKDTDNHDAMDLINQGEVYAILASPDLTTSSRVMFAQMDAWFSAIFHNDDVCSDEVYVDILEQAPGKLFIRIYGDASDIQQCFDAMMISTPKRDKLQTILVPINTCVSVSEFMIPLLDSPSKLRNWFRDCSIAHHAGFIIEVSDTVREIAMADLVPLITMINAYLEGHVLTAPVLPVTKEGVTNKWNIGSSDTPITTPLAQRYKLVNAIQDYLATATNDSSSQFNINLLAVHYHPNVNCWKG